ncbi:hypothetical protein QE152_g9270 [Popillia japonica]|uniref:Reverse transcriptase domain-containing protein n=1 Tax=Popillia japonica TaxID=7064 RepID=A0AAW1LZM9_POPJA
MISEMLAVIECGSAKHLANKCERRDAICDFCGIKGHLQSVCTKKKNVNTKSHSTRSVQKVDEITNIYHIDSPARGKILLQVTINDVAVVMEMDSGAAVSLMGLIQFKEHFPHLQIRNTNIQLVSYCQMALKIKGVVTVSVSYEGRTKSLELYIVEGNKDALLGREWIRALKIQIPDSELGVRQVTTKRDEHIRKLLATYGCLFDNKLGKMEGIQAHLKIKEGATPVFVKSRPVPFALLDKIENELDLLVNEGILSKVDNSLWASPIVPVSKANGDIRICGDFKVSINPYLVVDEYHLPTIDELLAGDFKVSINPYLVVDEYHLPTIDELLATMAGGDKFTKIDLSRAYLQLEVAPEDRHLLTLNTHKGLYQANRLLYGVASAPAIWQREIEKILQGIPGVSVFLDDIKITGPDGATHLTRLNLMHFHGCLLTLKVYAKLMSQIYYKSTKLVVY